MSKDFLVAVAVLTALISGIAGLATLLTFGPQIAAIVAGISAIAVISYATIMWLKNGPRTPKKTPSPKP